MHQAVEDGRLLVRPIVQATSGNDGDLSELDSDLVAERDVQLAGREATSNTAQSFGQNDNQMQTSLIL